MAESAGSSELQAVGRLATRRRAGRLAMHRASNAANAAEGSRTLQVLVREAPVAYLARLDQLIERLALLAERHLAARAAFLKHRLLVASEGHIPARVRGKVSDDCFRTLRVTPCSSLILPARRSPLAPRTSHLAAHSTHTHTRTVDPHALTHAAATCPANGTGAGRSPRRRGA